MTVGKKTTNKTREKSALNQGQFVVILEDINSKMDLVVEGYKTLDEKKDRLHHELSGKIDRNHREVLEFKKETIEFQKKTDDNFKTIFEYLSRIDDELHNIKIEIKELKNSLNKKADLERLEALEKKVVGIEKENIQMRSIFKQHNLIK